MRQKKLIAQKIIDTIVEAAEEKKAVDLKVIEIKNIGYDIYSMVVMTGESTPQLKAIGWEIEDKLKKIGIKNLQQEGDPQSGWIILDVGTTVVHIMAPKERKYYNLEELWGKEGIVYHY